MRSKEDRSSIYFRQHLSIRPFTEQEHMRERTPQSYRPERLLYKFKLFLLVIAIPLERIDQIRLK